MQEFDPETQNFVREKIKEKKRKTTYRERRKKIKDKESNLLSLLPEKSVSFMEKILKFSKIVTQNLDEIRGSFQSGFRRDKYF